MFLPSGESLLAWQWSPHFLKEITMQILDGTLAVEVEAVYPIRKIKEAVAHAARSGRSGKILVSFARE